MSRAAEKNKPPSMPSFDEATVRQMLNSIDEVHNLSLLRAGYFSGHRRSPFPVTDGFAVLKSTLATQKPGDLKWFMLEALRGSASFHAQEIPLDDGFEAYGLIFDNANLATTSRTQTAVRTSVRDFVTSINTSLKRKDGQYDPRVADLLVKAWNISKNLPPSATDARRPLDWSRAIEAAYAQYEFTAIVEAALKDTAHPPDFMMLKLAVIVFQNDDKSRAIELLKAAQKKLPSNNRLEPKWLYGTWMQLITGNDPKDQLAPKVTDKSTLAQLVEMRKDQTSYTGKGYDKLLKLYWQLEENDKANDLLTAVKGQGVRASEKIDVAKVLLRPSADLKLSKETTAQLQEQGISLLQTYLTAAQERQPDDEIRARYELGRYFVKQDLITEALQALNVDALKPPARYTEAAMYYAQILKMKADLAEKLKGVEGV